MHIFTCLTISQSSKFNLKKVRRACRLRNSQTSLIYSQENTINRLGNSTRIDPVETRVNIDKRITVSSRREIQSFAIFLSRLIPRLASMKLDRTGCADSGNAAVRIRLPINKSSLHRKVASSSWLTFKRSRASFAISHEAVIASSSLRSEEIHH